LFLSVLRLCFFFSSRRRHTRSKRDWSSDVCSSDLESCFNCLRKVNDDTRPDLPARWELPQESAGTMDLTAMFESTAHKFPHKEALVFADTAATYAELLEASKKSAAALRDAGVAKGSRVGVMTFNTPGFVVAALGIWRAGATLVPINHKLSGTEVAYLAEHSGISLGIVSEELAATASEAAPEIDWLTTNDDLTGSFDAAVGQAPAWEGVAVSEEDVAQILYTSGTVSRPKGCMHSHRGLATVAA